VLVRARGSILTEIRLWHACSCDEVADGTHAVPF
jgi:hypothetical protein